MDAGSASRDDKQRELPVANLDGARIYSAGWVEESSRVFAVWHELPSGAVALQTFTLGGPLGQDQQAHIICAPDK